MANKAAYHSVVIDENGNGKQGSITVYAAGTIIVATIYASPAGAPLTNPFDTDELGRFSFFAIPGEYDIEVGGSGLVPYKLESVSIMGPAGLFIKSDPQSAHHRIKNIRLDAAGKVVVTYDGTPEA